MTEDHFLRCKVYAAAAWILAVTLLVAGWILLLFDGDDWRIAGGLGLTALAMTAVAATLQIRAFNVRVCVLIRASYGLDRFEVDRSVGLHPIP